MPLTTKGSEILSQMEKTYGSAKGKEVFYASRNAGKITGVDAKDMSSEEFDKLDALFSQWIKEEKDEKEHASDALAFDNFQIDLGPISGRKKDENGFMHVRCHISKACVNPYRGSEIPRSEELGLDQNRIYHLLRDPAELAAAAPTFNNMPMMSGHPPNGVSSSNSEQHRRVGSLGTDTTYVHPYLDNTLVIWDDEPQAGIETDQVRELSSSYRYDADMVSGEYEGTKYDGVMRNIRGNHVALVPAGRAGSDVIVGDAALSGEDFIMPVKPRSSMRAVLALGAITGYISPKLASDAKLDATGIKTVLAATNDKNWLQQKPRLAMAIMAAIGATKFATDAKPEDVHALLDSLDAVVAKDEEMDGDRAKDAEEETEEEKKARLERRADDRKAGRDCAADEEDETDEEKKHRKEARDRRAKDKRMGADASEEDRDKAEKEHKAEDRRAWDARMGARDSKKGMDKQAMDAAIRTAVAAAETRAENRVIARLNSIKQAETDVRPHVGAVFSMDSAEEIYRYALDNAGIEHADIKEVAALRRLVTMLPKPGDLDGGGTGAVIARDSAMTGGGSDAWLKTFGIEA